MSLNILLLEDVHASATPILHAVPGAEVLRMKHAPDAHELESLLHLKTEAGFGVAVVDLSRPLDGATLTAVTGVEGTVRAFTVRSPA